MSSLLLAGAVTVILAGGDNAAGNGGLTAGDKLADNSNVAVLTSANGLRDNGEPWSGTGSGLGRPLAAALQQGTGEPAVFIVACGKNGSTAVDWLPNSPTGLMNRCVQLALKAQEFDAPVVGLIWLHGESEGDSLARANAYGARVGQILDGFRDKLALPNLPIVGIEPAWVGQAYHYQVLTGSAAAVGTRQPSSYIGTEQYTPVNDKLWWSRACFHDLAPHVAEALLALNGGSW